MTVIERHNVRVSGTGTRPMLFAHGFGCDQAMWRLVAPAFEADYRVVLFDYLGHGGSDRSAYDPARYALLDGYADDVLAICRAMDLRDVVLVGHSVSATIAVMAAIREPGRFASLVLVGPSPRYLDDGDYVGGFSRADVDGLLEALEANHVAWAGAMASTIMGNPDRPELGRELADSFCRTDPEVAREFARATFLSDNRADLPRVPVPALVIQCERDAIAPRCVGEYVHRHLPDGRLVVLDATGHCPHLSEPGKTIAAIRDFLAEPEASPAAAP